MTKYRKMVLSIILTLLVSFVLVGCGQKDKDDKERRGDWGEATTEEITEKATQEVTEVAPDVATKLEADHDHDENKNKTKASKTDADKDSKNSKDLEEESKKASNGKVIVLDPGHSNVVTGNTEPLGPGSSEMKAADASGTRGTTTGLTEIELNFQIATKLKMELEARGYTVILTREDNDTAISCAERAQVANDAHADAFIRIHADGSESSSASGAMGICITSFNPYVPEMYSESRILSDDILNEYVAATGFSSRGVWETDTMTGNNWSEVPCTLLEMGFMTNPNEDTLMADPDFQIKMVDGIANGVDRYFFTD